MEKTKVMKLAYDALGFQRNAIHAGMCSLVSEASSMHLELQIDPKEFETRENEYDKAITFRTSLIQTLDTARENIAEEFLELYGVPISQEN